MTQTPGQPITVTDETFANSTFSLRYPRGWRVVTGAAASPPGVTLIAPGDCALIVVSAAAITMPPTLPETCAADRITTRRDIVVGAVSTTMMGVVVAAEAETFVTVFERVADTITVQP
ncbi:MAG: hypothetical protein SGI73_02455 [Chloroflexota bacterium]|nr:hypothetical protein [Chloroflexota bacterium]